MHPNLFSRLSIFKNVSKSIDIILNARLLTKKSNVNHRTREESEEIVPVCIFFFLGGGKQEHLPNDHLLVIKEKHNLSMQ